VNVLSGATVSLQNNFNLTTNTSATPNSTLTVNSGGTLMCGTYIVSNNNTGAAGKFVNNGTLGIGDPAGITSGTTLLGNIQVTAATSARSFRPLPTISIPQLLTALPATVCRPLLRVILRSTPAAASAWILPKAPA
jgi:hypothetical protein